MVPGAARVTRERAADALAQEAFAPCAQLADVVMLVRKALGAGLAQKGLADLDLDLGLVQRAGAATMMR